MIFINIIFHTNCVESSFSGEKQNENYFYSDLSNSFNELVNIKNLLKNTSLNNDLKEKIQKKIQEKIEKINIFLSQTKNQNLSFYSEDNYNLNFILGDNEKQRPNIFLEKSIFDCQEIFDKIDNFFKFCAKYLQTKISTYDYNNLLLELFKGFFQETKNVKEWIQNNLSNDKITTNNINEIKNLTQEFFKKPVLFSKYNMIFFKIIPEEMKKQTVLEVFNKTIDTYNKAYPNEHKRSFFYEALFSQEGLSDIIKKTNHQYSTQTTIDKEEIMEKNGKYSIDKLDFLYEKFKELFIKKYKLDINYQINISEDQLFTFFNMMQFADLTNNNENKEKTDLEELKLVLNKLSELDKIKEMLKKYQKLYENIGIKLQKNIPICCSQINHNENHSNHDCQTHRSTLTNTTKQI